MIEVDTKSFRLALRILLSVRPWEIILSTSPVNSSDFGKYSKISLTTIFHTNPAQICQLITLAKITYFLKDAIKLLKLDSS